MANDGKYRHEIASEPELLCRNVDLTRPLIALNAIGTPFSGNSVVWSTLGRPSTLGSKDGIEAGTKV
ncbi:hypothetical protein NMA58_25290 (plasmid) [Rhizobium sp. YTUHZ045]|uniref:hypothetical protein n=1 Tax=Rhizobium sp. YTUHZ045 TaxID=2962888 RepID=UPI003DA89792